MKGEWMVEQFRRGFDYLLSGLFYFLPTGLKIWPEFCINAPNFIGHFFKIFIFKLASSSLLVSTNLWQSSNFIQQVLVKTINHPERKKSKASLPMLVNFATLWAQWIAVASRPWCKRRLINWRTRGGTNQ